MKHALCSAGHAQTQRESFQGTTAASVVHAPTSHISLESFQGSDNTEVVGKRGTSRIILTQKLDLRRAVSLLLQSIDSASQN
jgi:hypothetical protein